MGKLSGTVLILAGVSIAAYTLFPQPDAVTNAMTAENAAQAKPPSAPATSTPAAAPKPADSPAPPNLAPPSPRTETAPATSPPPATIAPPTVAPQKLRPGVPPAVRVAEAPLRLPVGESAATASPPLDRPALTREIQRQLKRIGCYQGDVSGVWSPAVRQAAKALTDRVNASLPTDQPDPVLLAMVQGQAAGTCAAGCPQGESRAADGRCLPAAIVANAGKQRTPTASAQAGRAQVGHAQTRQAAKTRPSASTPATAGDTVAPPSPDGRMSLAGPKADMSRQARVRPQRPRVASTPPRATAYYNYRPGPRVRQRSAQRSGTPFWSIPFLMP